MPGRVEEAAGLDPSPPRSAVLSSSPSPCSSHFENGMLKPRLRRLMTSAGSRLLTVLFRMSLVLLPWSLRLDGDPGRELREIVVEKRRPRFERGEHGRPVDLGQEIVLEVHGEIHVEQLGKAVGEVLALEARCAPNRRGRRRRGPRGPAAREPPAASPASSEPNQVWWRSTRSCSAADDESAQEIVEGDVAHRHRRQLEGGLDRRRW